MSSFSRIKKAAESVGLSQFTVSPVPGRDALSLKAGRFEVTITGQLANSRTEMLEAYILDSLLEQGAKLLYREPEVSIEAPSRAEPSVWDRGLILNKANALITGDRQETYGDAAPSFERIGKVWGAMLNREPISAPHVAIMMVAFKGLRGMNNPGHIDDYVDMAGYAALGGEIARIKYEEK